MSENRKKIARTLAAIGLVFGLISGAFCQTFPRVEVRYSLPNNSELSEIVKNSYSVDDRVANEYLIKKIATKYPNGMTREEAISFGFSCNSAKPVSCSYSGKVSDEVVGVQPSQVAAGRRRDVLIHIEVPSVGDTNGIKYTKQENSKN